MLQEGARCFLFFTYIFCFLVHMVIAQSPSDFDDGDFDVQDDFLQHGFTVVNSTWQESKYRSAIWDKEQYLTDEEAILPSKTFKRRYKRQSLADQLVYSGEDPCNENTTLCTGIGQECKFDDTAVNGYQCVCSDDHDQLNATGPVCAPIPENRKMYLTITLAYAFNSSLNNSNSPTFLQTKLEVEIGLSPYFSPVLDYKTLKVKEFRNNKGNTQVVLNLFFWTGVSFLNSVNDVARRVLEMEKSRLTVNITGTPVQQIGLTGVFRTYSDTSQTEKDAVDWCMLNVCDSDRICLDDGVDPRYTCKCMTGAVEIGRHCEDMYEYTSHKQIPKSDDGTEVVNVPSGIPVAKTLQYRLWIGVNGLISFGQANRGTDFQLRPDRMMVGPYLTDIITLGRTGDIHYQVYSNRLTEERLFSRTDDMMKEFTQVDSYSTKLVIVVTWSNVSHYSSRNPSMETATFQTVLTSDGSKSYVLVIYKKGSMNWVHRPNTPLIIGISQGQGEPVKPQLFSNTRQAFQELGDLHGNTGRRGMWLYELGEAYSADLDCDNWYQSEFSNRNALLTAFRRMPECPCTNRAMSSRWTRSNNLQNPDLECYRLSRAASWEHRPHNKECCYRSTGSSTSRPASFEGNVPFASGLLANWVSPGADYSDNYQWHDVCCYQALSPESCTKKYYDLRPIGTCTNRADNGVSNTVGDPHIKTLDGKEYTFNGRGEYSLVRVLYNGTDFSLQGRTDLAINANGSAINATVFTAFAAREGDVTVQVELDPVDKTFINIKVQEGKEIKDFSLQFKNNVNFSVEEVAYTLMRSNLSLVAAFPSDISVTITVGHQLLDIAVSLPNSLQSRPRGLAGNFNGNPNDDFVLPNGTMLSPNMTEREIFYSFGQAWGTTANESVFIYDATQRKSHADYQYPNFRPIFLDEASEEQKNQSYIVCGGKNNIACVYDFIATQSQQFAEATRTSKDSVDVQDKQRNNSAPSISGHSNVTVATGQVIYFQLSGNDMEDTQVTYRMSRSARGNITLDSNTGNVTYTVGNQTDARDKLEFYAEDSMETPSPILFIPIVYCPECNHGVCDRDNPRSDSLSDSFIVASCACHEGWTGAYCNKDYNGCAESPCVQGQNCSDVPASIHSQNYSYICGPCPSGYEVRDGKCSDIDECNNSSSHHCQQHCNNTEGSYVCSCAPGYRLSPNDRTCDDINECVERTAQCQQHCQNTEGAYNCSCRSGFISNGSRCDPEPDPQAMCQQAGCQNTEQECAIVNSTARCFCKQGYKVDPNNSSRCVDDNECDARICMQDCTNTYGSFRCSCYAGYHLDTDGTTCVPCPPVTYGLDCNRTCSCNGRSDSCHPVTGCQCERGWRGENCQINVDECTETPGICGGGLQVCVDLQGSYRCDCLPGYFRENSSVSCKDLNECQNASRCAGTNEQCVNTVGSYSCVCREGYARVNGSSNCTNVDECSSQTAGCEQICMDNQGSYVCACNFGFRLKTDRRTCEKAEDVCKASLNCTHECTLNDKDQPYCFCRDGFRLAADLQTCFDVNECSDGSHQCSRTCVNTPGSYVCTCPVGMQLDNDQRSCHTCSAGTFGTNCSQSCQCGQGSSGCDPVTGCTCRSGWTGTRCDQDINECATPGVQAECAGLKAGCENLPGTYRCVCELGYILTNTSTGCEDVNECQSGPCSQICQNTAGSFRCLCRQGYTYNSSNSQCQDSNECALSSTNRCQGNCINTDGSYRCDCNYQPGLVLNDDGFTCRARTECANPGLCPSVNGGCTVNETGTHVCYCTQGYILDPNNSTNCNLEERDWCGEARCDQTCTNTTAPPYFTCSCDGGYQLNNDGRTCLVIQCAECASGIWGLNCSNTCTCDTFNSELCNKSDGSCLCKAGWEGSNCTQDVDECTNNVIQCVANSLCLNNNGSYLCVCEKGFFKTADGNCSECEEGFYDDCSKPCQCHKLNTQSCNRQNGSCTCLQGWQGVNCSVDVDECDKTTHPYSCNGSHQLCQNTEGGYDCLCQKGYQFDSNGNCVDQNECFDHSHNCSEYARCQNNDGGFNCICSAGFVGYNCTDNNECSVDNGGCNQICNNTGGSFSCSCHRGYTLGNDSITCKDINECSVNNGGCNQICNNTDGSFNCSCHRGYTLSNDSMTCQDVNECEGPYSCPPTQDNCTNTDGSYICSCQHGYELSQGTCKDKDECKNNNGGCSQHCNNADGGYHCYCDNKHVLDENGKTCNELKDITFTITVNIDYPNLTEILNKNDSDDYYDLKTQMEATLFAELNKTAKGLLNVTVIRMWKGSLNAETIIIVDFPDMSALAKGIFGLINSNFTVGNYTAYAVGLTVNDKEVTGVCDLLPPCEDGTYCDSNGICKKTISEVSDIIALAVGIPLASIAVTAVVVVVIIIIRKRRKAKALNIYDDARSEHASPFTHGIAKRGSWGPNIWNNRPFLSPDSISNASSGSDNRRARMGVLQAHRSDFTTWSDRGSRVSEIRNPPNFSWDFFFEQFDPDSEFSIKRPKVALTPNPTFQPEAEVSSFS